jgi:hypothetical protein
MKLLWALLLVGIPLAAALQSQKPVIVMYPQDTPDSVLGQAKQAIIEAVCHALDPPCLECSICSRLVVSRAASLLMSTVSSTVPSDYNR